MTKYVKVIIFILLGLTSSANLQDVIEASGEPEPNDAGTPYNLIDPESSGDGLDDVGSIGEKVDIIADHVPFENETFIPVVNNGNLNAKNDSFLVGDLDTTTLPGQMPETSSAGKEIQTTTLESTTSVLTTEAPSKKTTNAPLETTQTETTTETTTTEQQTTAPPTKRTTTIRTTTIRGPTTRRTTIPKTLKTTSKSAETSTISSTTHNDQEVHACTFVEEDFMCDLEIACFGDGVVDCIDVEDETEITTMYTQHGATDSEDYEEENGELFTDSGILTGRVHAIKSPSLMWKIHSMSTASSDTTARANIRTESTTTAAVSSTSSKDADPTVTGPDTTTIADNNQRMTTTTTEAVTSTDITTEPSSTGTNIGLFDTSPNSQNSDATANPLQTPKSNMEDINGENAARNNSFTEMPSEHAEIHPTTLEMTTALPGQLSARKKRNDDPKTQQKADSLRMSSSESLHSSKPSKGTNVVKRCRIIGNLQCKPFPFTSFCKGRGTCKVLVEKTEKSTSEKKVENWAIIVIAICATAAALTVSLLIYLVVSSWKKLKVQPQNGVTTLTYVNSTPP